MNEELASAVTHLETYGYCVLELRIPEEDARRMAADFLAFHDRPEFKKYIHYDALYQTLFGMVKLDDRVWNCIGHPDVGVIARHFLGPNCRFVEACSKPVWPNAPAQTLHTDSAGEFAVVPDIPWMINTIWMLTDFTVENGATGVVPMSHRSRLKRPPVDLDITGPLVKPVTGTAGSVMLWHGGLFHMARANTSDTIRVGLNVAYYPRWFNNWVEGGHQPVWPETFARMPEDMKRLCPGLQGVSREERYEKYYGK
ncbi:MAG: phytanoyl-CoA dioxygenase family protein [candidate division Zixibacteria bacterium]|nr:phytanoyl-CoA dioxygenase family protein [candidate division Zixibacteria bacterium]